MAKGGEGVATSPPSTRWWMNARVAANRDALGEAWWKDAVDAAAWSAR